MSEVLQIYDLDRPREWQASWPDRGKAGGALPGLVGRTQAIEDSLTSQDVILLDLVGVSGHLEQALESVCLDEANRELGVILRASICSELAISSVTFCFRFVREGQMIFVGVNHFIDTAIKVTDWRLSE